MSDKKIYFNTHEIFYHRVKQNVPSYLIIQSNKDNQNFCWCEFALVWYLN